MNCLQKNSGIILIPVLWVVIILSLLAMGLGRLSSGSMALLETSAGRIKAAAAARSGIFYVRGLLSSARTGGGDTLYACGIKLNGKKPLEVFAGRALEGGAHFDISFQPWGYSLEAKESLVYGIQDESRRLNINALNFSDGSYKVLSYLLQQFGVSSSAADGIALAVADWMDADDQASKMSTGEGAEKSYYQSLKGYTAKNRFFSVPEELMMVKGVTPEIYARIKDVITVYPQGGDIKVNWRTASRPVMQAYADWQKKPVSVVESMVRVRDGNDGVSFTADDGVGEASDFALDQAGSAALMGFEINTPARFFRVRSVGVDEATGARAVIEAVLDAGVQPAKVIAWHRE